ncbi:flagellin [Aquidulcibacter sp.]|jgi:flagellin|uniref:flagellin N-terminal helical domain-containing protein n=1 Tax=Aquidulcibacter sp. TaxID=2052990 RepID=UPI000BC5BE8D|nr:flagellin [Aquidulcibacter sp.]MCA3695781.1 flagellin [Aquidulcibacter sp.]OYU53668.1 MAG: flagellin [Alphaproteobacteria bacterium PA1]
MSGSVHTNMGAMTALQNLNKTNREMDGIQSRINTGLKVAVAKDNGAIYNIAQQQRSELSAYDAVRNSLNRAKSIADVALAAGEQISDIFSQMREKAVAASDASASTTSRAAYNAEFIALRDQVASVIANAVFDGGNAIDGAATNFTFLANSTGSLTVTLPIIDLRLAAGAGTAVASPAADVYLGTTDVLDTAANAATVRDRIAASLEYVNSELARLGASAKRIENHEIFVGKLQDSIKGGIGNLVDADLAVESARLQAAQVKQQLGTQALSIANQAPQSILSLFRQ